MKSKVVFADKRIKKAFERLEHSTTEDKMICKWLNRAFDDIASNAASGMQIPGKLIPKEYVKRYKIDNLWKYDLPNAWRLIYSIKRDKITVLSVILEWLNHKHYERRFGYD